MKVYIPYYSIGGRKMSNYHIGRRSPMLNQTVGTVESDVQYQVRYQVEEAKAESHMWKQYGK